jgi:hypothetical protein
MNAWILTRALLELHLILLTVTVMLVMSTTLRHVTGMVVIAVKTHVWMDCMGVDRPSLELRLDTQTVTRKIVTLTLCLGLETDIVMMILTRTVAIGMAVIVVARLAKIPIYMNVDLTKTELSLVLIVMIRVS